MVAVAIVLRDLGIIMITLLREIFMTMRMESLAAAAFVLLEGHLEEDQVLLTRGTGIIHLQMRLHWEPFIQGI